MNKINRQELAKAIHENAVAKGFWGEKHSPEHYLMLVITELSEAVEAWRTDYRADREAYDTRSMNGFDTKVFEIFIKDTVADELADAYIRLLDLAEGFDWEIESEYKDNGVSDDGVRDRTFIESIYHAVDFVITSSHQESVSTPLYILEAIATKYDIDLAWHIEEKMKYNATRPHLHGKRC